MKQIAGFKLEAYAKSCIHQPAYHYLETKFDDEFNLFTTLAFKAAHYFLPSKLNNIKPTATEIESLHAFTFLDSTPVFDDLKL